MPVYFNTETKDIQLKQYFRREEKNESHAIKVTAAVFKARLDGALSNLV